MTLKMNKKMPNKTHLRERLIASTLYMPEEEIVEKRDGTSMLLIFSIVLNVFFVSILIMNTISPNKTITRDQEQKLDIAIERMTEVTDFIKLNGNQ